MTGQHRKPERPRKTRDFPELPPRPDALTGEPFPPHAPGYRGNDRVAPEHDPNRNTRLSYKPDPPDAMGPVIAWHRDSTWGNIKGFLISFVVFVTATAFLFFLDDGSLRGFGYWQIWALAVVFAFLMYNPRLYETSSAGADWIQWQYTRRWYQRQALTNYLKIYELSRIEAYHAGSGINSWLQLRLADLDGRGMDRTLGDLQRDRRIWDLLYNGILHSVANGAQINQAAIGLLKLDETPALKLRDTPEPS